MFYSADIKSFLCSIEEKRECCKAAFESGRDCSVPKLVCARDKSCYMRGLFTARGYVSSPRSSGLLTLSLSEGCAEYAGSVLESEGIPAKRGTRRGKPILYYRESGGIEDFLSYIGASRFALELMEHKVIKELRGDANRIRNAETANMDRTARAAVEQCEAINIIIEHKEFQKLPPELRECAELRLANPDMSLDELRGLFRYPISKSGLNHRFVRIIDIARRLRK